MVKIVIEVVTKNPEPSPELILEAKLTIRKEFVLRYCIGLNNKIDKETNIVLAVNTSFLPRMFKYFPKYIADERFTIGFKLNISPITHVGIFLSLAMSG